MRLGFEVHESASNDFSQSIIDLERNVVAIGGGFTLKGGFLPEGRSAQVDFTYQRSILKDASVEARGEGSGTSTAGGNVDTLVGGLRYEI